MTPGDRSGAPDGKARGDRPAAASTAAPIALALTGASGAPYWRRLLEVLLAEGIEVHLAYSEAAEMVARAELDQSVPAILERVRARMGETAAAGRLRVFGRNEFTAPLASGSAPYRGMAIVPCSQGTLGRIARGVSDDLISRAADVMLKERRRLVLVFREAPLSLVHLENMVAVTRAGAVVLPAAPGFYHRPRVLGDLVDFVVQRICNQLAVPVRLVAPWGSDDAADESGEDVS